MIRSTGARSPSRCSTGLAEVLGKDRFLREIELTAGLTHPHILALYDSGVADGLAYYVMPFVEGKTLREYLSEKAVFRSTRRCAS
jgi:serine/threonine protein kinase